MNDTIAAIATAAGAGGIGIVRISGGHSNAIAKQVIGYLPSVRQAVYAAFQDANQQTIDSGIVIRFAAPASFTGEDGLELQAHGGRVILNLVLQRVLQCGARLASPGEFSQRAFLNQRIDLTQAEAIADLISAATDAAAISAQRSLQGGLSQRVANFSKAILELRARAEAYLDFPDDTEEVTLPLFQPLVSLQQQLQQMLASAQRGQLLRDGIRLVLAGTTNVGKSSLLNQLAGDEVAIVTPIPGTTRDPVQTRIAIGGVAVQLIDTAGIRRTGDDIERIGMERTQRYINQADVLLIVEDDSQPSPSAARTQIFNTLRPQVPIIVVRNKIDLSGAKPRISTTTQGYKEIRLCALSGAGVEQLRQTIGQTISDCMSCAAREGDDHFSARTRHLDAMRRTASCLQRAMALLNTVHAPVLGLELVAEELRQAHRTMNEITSGGDDVEALLERIFADFCIGK